MNTELFYLVGNPNSLKQIFLSQLKEKLSNEASIIVPQVYTTDKVVAEDDNYIYLDERDFLLRESMGIYCLSWKVRNEYYGVGGDFEQRLNSGVDVILNGSLHNLDQATKHFPNLNVVMIKKQGGCVHDTTNQYLIADDDGVTLEWSSKHEDIGHPYILTLESDDNMEKAIEMFVNLVTYERNAFEKVV